LIIEKSTIGLFIQINLFKNELHFDAIPTETKTICYIKETFQNITTKENASSEVEICSKLFVENDHTKNNKFRMHSNG